MKEKTQQLVAKFGGVLFATCLTAYGLIWANAHGLLRVAAQERNEAPSEFTQDASAPISKTEVRFYLGELVPCLEKLGGRIETSEEGGVRQVLQPVGDTIELRLEKGVAVLGAYVVQNDEVSLGYQMRVFDPDGRMYFLGENDFAEARDFALRKCK